MYDPHRTLDVTRICIGNKQKPRDIARGLDRMLKRDYAAIPFRFLRQPSRPSAPRPVKSGSVAGTATLETGVNVTDTPLPPRRLKLSP